MWFVNRLFTIFCRYFTKILPKRPSIWKFNLRLIILIQTGTIHKIVPVPVIVNKSAYLQCISSLLGKSKLLIFRRFLVLFDRNARILRLYRITDRQTFDL